MVQSQCKDKLITRCQSDLIHNCIIMLHVNDVPLEPVFLRQQWLLSRCLSLSTPPLKQGHKEPDKRLLSMYQLKWSPTIALSSPLFLHSYYCSSSNIKSSVQWYISINNSVQVSSICLLCQEKKNYQIYVCFSWHTGSASKCTCLTHTIVM